MWSQKPFLRLLVLLTAAQIGGLGLALWIQSRLLLSAAYQAAEAKASAALAADAERVLAAVNRRETPPDGSTPASRNQGPEGAASVPSAARVPLHTAADKPPLAPGANESPRTAPGERDLESVCAVLRDAQLPQGVGWWVTDLRWRILAASGASESDSPGEKLAGQRLAWREPPAATDQSNGQIAGRVMLPDGPHSVIASRLNGNWGYVVTHQPLASVPLAPTVLSESLLAAMAIAWAWTSPVAAILTYLIVAGLREGLTKKDRHREEEALRRIQSLARARDAVILGLASLAESRDEITGRHVERVSYYSSRLALAASRNPRFREVITSQFVRDLAVGSMLHDIGKVGIEDRILFKPGPLTPSERVRMQRHSTLGGKYLREIERLMGPSSMIHMAREIALWHHERWDGKGYPDRLAGEEIPLSARIVAVADVYEALRSLRDYKPPYPHERCVEIIRGEAGRQFDPDLVEAFLTLEESFHHFSCQSADTALPRRHLEIDDLDADGDPPRAGMAAGMNTLDENATDLDAQRPHVPEGLENMAPTCPEAPPHDFHAAGPAP